MEMIRDRGNLNGVVQVPNLAANNILQKIFIASNHFCPRDSKNGENQEEAKKKEEEDIELTLGLSLNGQFGTDPRSRKRKNFELGRSSSITEGFVFDEQRSGGDMKQTVERGFSDMFHLDRTRSLPVETETKRTRSEKTRTFLDFQVPLPRKEKNGVQTEGKDVYTLDSVNNEADHARGVLEFKVPTPTKRNFHVPTPVNGKGKNGNTTTTKKKVPEVCGMEKARNILEDMPCVSTRDVGADGKRVEGFLYWYGGNKEEVKIVCVCHGSFLSPAEFVKHGGVTVSDDGGDVNINPLRHIVVKLPSSSL